MKNFSHGLPRASSRGSVTLLVIVFGAVFFAILAALSGYVLAENRAESQTRQKAEAVTIAEGGLEYYHWFLAHFPGNLTNGTGHAGPYVFAYADPLGSTAGTVSLAIAGTVSCGQVTSITVTSTGTPADAPTVSSTLFARYAQPSVANYSYILNANAWFTSTIFGPLHTNGGIRMDGTPNAPVTSSLATFLCDSTLGCSPSATQPGVFGSGANPNLWQYPVPQTDFAGIAADFSSLKTTANSSGIYYARTSTAGNTHLGYHLIFNAAGTVTVRRVTAVSGTLTSLPVDGSSASGTNPDYSLITAETNLGTFAISANCGLIFIEDNVWVEGTVKGKVTLVAADVIHPGVYPNAVIPNNLIYNTYDGSAGLTVIASHDVLIGPSTPATLTMNGIFIAQTGAFGRNLYTCAFPAYAVKTNLTILGSIVSALKPGTAWNYSGINGCPAGSFSGYSTRVTSYDRQNAQNPPPFTPITSTQFEFVDWRQVN